MVDKFWRIFISVDVPQFPERLQALLKETRDQFLVMDSVQPVTKRAWLQRIWRLKTRIESLHVFQFPEQRRHKRGFFNAFGDLSHLLFGTATDKQVKKTMSMINKVRHQNQVITHVVANMATVVNHTLLSVKENRQRINEVAARMNQLEASIADTLNISKIVIANHARHEAERILETLTIMTDIVMDEFWNFRGKRSSLEIAHLTEFLLPPRVLKKHIS